MTRVATWNVNSLKARFEKVCDWISNNKPDVLCLQETKLKNDAFITYQEKLSDLGFHSCHHGNSQWNGVAIISKRPIKKVADNFNGNPLPDEARMLHVEINGVNYINLYVPNGREVGSVHFKLKLDWLDKFEQYLKKQDLSKGFIILGDFNIAPTYLDVYDEEALKGSTHVTLEEREKIAKLLSLGFVDAFRFKQGDSKAFSWWDYRAGSFHKNQGLRIDLILISQEIADKITTVFIDKDARKKPTPSDHAPVVMDLKD